MTIVKTTYELEIKDGKDESYRCGIGHGCPFYETAVAVAKSKIERRDKRRHRDIKIIKIETVESVLETFTSRQ